VNDYEVFYRKASGPPTVYHVDVQAHTVQEAQEEAAKLLPKTVTIFRVDELPAWEVTPSIVQALAKGI
jgi:glycerol dehydrogenase-like iron-containing ADH family enzyme